MTNLYLCLTERHDATLLALSACICLLGCFTSVTLLARARVAASHAAVRWILAASATFGGSVWALHFVAMLAFRPGQGIAYDGALTLLSAVVATMGALGAFMILHRLGSGPVRTLCAGASLAAGIAGMHYCGVGAMRLSGSWMLDAGYVAASIAVCLVFGILTFARSENLDRLARRCEVTVWLTVAICGLHFTGMTGLSIALSGPSELAGSLLGSSALAIAVAVAALAVLVASLTIVVVGQQKTQRIVSELARMRLLSNLAHEALLIHRDGTVLEANTASERLFGLPATGIVGRCVFDLFAPEHLPALLRRSHQPQPDLYPEEVEIFALDRTRVPVELICQPIDYLGKPCIAVALRDLSDRKRDEARIRHLARHDALTDLPNRSALEERLRFTLASAERNGTGIAVMYLDLDRFKPINDLYGHATGDAVLIQAALRLAAEIRAADTLARIGGDEFVAVLAGALSPEAVESVGRRMIEALTRPFEIEGQRLEIGVSLGIALYPGDGREPEALLQAADLAMYRAKDEAHGGLRFYEASMNAQLRARRQLESELRHAIARGELALVYQPLVDGTTGEVEAFEALIRWHHPQRGLVSPIEFIPLAEQADLMGPIGRWVVETACAAAARWEGPWRVSVNVSPVQFRQDDLVATVAAALARHALDPARLVIEITEGVFIADAAKAVEILSGLRALGVRIALDDFGTGYSSLSYLQLFTFDKLKIDKSFVQRLGKSMEAATIVNAIVTLGHTLGLEVTAEGVETLEQLTTLRRLGCDQIQGYLVARPAPAGTFTDLDRARTRAMFVSVPERLSA